MHAAFVVVSVATRRPLRADVVTACPAAILGSGGATSSPHATEADLRSAAPVVRERLVRGHTKRYQALFQPACLPQCCPRSELSRRHRPAVCKAGDPVSLHRLTHIRICIPIARYAATRGVARLSKDSSEGNNNLDAVRIRGMDVAGTHGKDVPFGPSAYPSLARRHATSKERAPRIRHARRGLGTRGWARARAVLAARETMRRDGKPTGMRHRSCSVGCVEGTGLVASHSPRL